MQSSTSMVGRYSRLVNDVKNDPEVLRNILNGWGQLVEEITFHPIILSGVDSDETLHIYEEFKLRIGL